MARLFYFNFLFMKTHRTLFLLIVCLVAVSTKINAQVYATPSPGNNGMQNFYFNKPGSNLKVPFNFASPIIPIEPGLQQSQFHFDLLKATEQNRYYQLSLDKMICLTPNKPINDNLNAMPIYKIQELSKMPNGFPKSEMITIK